MTSNIKNIEDQILSALGHHEGEDGLYFNNLVVVDEEEERPVVSGDDEEVRLALQNLLAARSISASGEGDTTIYRLVSNN